MTGSDPASLEQRVLVLTPTSKDASLTASVLQRAGVTSYCCSDLAHVCRELDAGAGAVLLPEEAVVAPHGKLLAEWLARQPPWSDLPLLVLARPGADSAAVAQAMDLLGNVMVLERPTRVSALVSAVRTALRARQRQYQIRSHLAEYRRVEDALRNANQRKDEFLAILAHELRNPLAPIRNSLNVLRRTLENDPAVAQLTGLMERQVNHMVRLVDDLLEVSRITRGKIELRMETVEVADVIRSAVETSRPLIEAAGHKLTVSMPAQPLRLHGDLVRLTQVVANLLNNAAKYTDRAGQIWLTSKPDGNEVVISVKDTGRGISPSMLPRVFGLFVQLDSHSDRAQGGLGIGLTLVKTLVELHGGAVSAHSAGIGQGSEFQVRLPMRVAQGSAPVSPPADHPAAAPLQLHILVADDNRDSANSLGMLLKLLGAKVQVVYDGADALEAVDSFCPDVAILDIGMPGMDGHEVARRIRQRPESKHVALIALTGWGQKQDRDRSQSAGFDYHLIKPVNFDALEELLTSLDSRHARQQADCEH